MNRLLSEVADSRRYWLAEYCDSQLPDYRIMCLKRLEDLDGIQAYFQTYSRLATHTH